LNTLRVNQPGRLYTTPHDTFSPLVSARLRSRPVPLYALLATAYIGLRIAGVVGVVTRRYPDSQSYLDVSRAHLFSTEFWGGARPWAAPLLYKLLPDSDAWRSAGQLGLSVVCWLALAAAFARCIERPRLRVAGFAVVLAFGLSPAITRWDNLILTESVAVSLTAAVLASWFAFVHRPTVSRVAVLLALTLLWVFARDTNIVLVLATALAVLASLVVSGHRSLRAALVVGLVGIVGAGMASTSTEEARLRRIERPILGAVGFRVLGDPGMERWFRAHGMPEPTPRVRANRTRLKGVGHGLPSDPETDAFLGWARSHARGTLARYLLTHPVAVTLPIFTKAGVLADTVPRYQRVGGHAVVPPFVRDVFYPPRAAEAFAVAAVVLAAAVFVAIRRRPRPAWLVPTVALLALVPYAAVNWYGDAFDVSRHAFLIAVTFRLCPLLLGLLLIDAWGSLVPRRRASRDRASSDRKQSAST
jgi:hypothetical protein